MIQAALYGAIAPFILVFIESIMPFASLVEEVVKACILWLNPHKLLKNRLNQALIVGLLFTISEAILYTTILINLNGAESANLRLIYTLPLHVGTCLLLSVPKPNQKYYRILVLLIAISIHYLFNNFIVG